MKSLCIFVVAAAFSNATTSFASLDCTQKINEQMEKLREDAKKDPSADGILKMFAKNKTQAESFINETKEAMAPQKGQVNKVNEFRKQFDTFWAEVTSVAGKKGDRSEIKKTWCKSAKSLGSTHTCDLLENLLDTCTKSKPPLTYSCISESLVNKQQEILAKFVEDKLDKPVFKVPLIGKPIRFRVVASGSSLIVTTANGYYAPGEHGRTEPFSKDALRSRSQIFFNTEVKPDGNSESTWVQATDERLFGQLDEPFVNSSASEPKLESYDQFLYRVAIKKGDLPKECLANVAEMVKEHATRAPKVQSPAKAVGAK